MFLETAIVVCIALASHVVWSFEITTWYQDYWAMDGSCVRNVYYPSLTCRQNSANYSSCMNKTKMPGDFDYLMLNQFYMPQFCHDLLGGNDLTNAHKDHSMFLDGPECLPSRMTRRMNIHRLWPMHVLRRLPKLLPRVEHDSQWPIECLQVDQL